MIISENCKLKDSIVCFVKTYEENLIDVYDDINIKFKDDCDLKFTLLENVYKKRKDKLIENNSILNTFKEKYNCHDFLKDMEIFEHKWKITSFKDKFMIFDDIEIKITDF